ncbi:WD40 repeat-like protein [Epithele typhae]|uniref:WD40 repeat-like protein n=1 Tax=Epithele typhae TaxID=378194 RepID=UPI0020087B23|nr:WD40 repeat-like protein [Epithele typhae]KAH9935945.1 WD40 repeat-like protein [Epithele typhae]
MAQPIILPISTVQHDFQAVVQDVLDGLVPEDKFWVSCYKTEEPSVHGKAVVALDENNRDLLIFRGQDGVEFKECRQGAYSVSCPSLALGETRVAVPSASYSSPEDIRKQGKQITAFDVAPNGTQFATGYQDGSVVVRPSSSSTSTPSVISKAHLSTVTSIRFFPSSRVLLTGGVDFSLSILSAEPSDTPAGYETTRATPVRTLRGHTRAITSTGIVARGRNVLSGSKDGSLRLWDVPTSAQIRTLAAGTNRFIPILALSTGERWKPDAHATDADGTPAEAPDGREVETNDKVVFCALQDGSFELFDLRTKRAEFRSPPGAAGLRSALQSIAYGPEDHLLVTGSASGFVSVHDTRTLGEGPITTFRRNSAPIEDINFASLSETSFSLGAPSFTGVGVAVATEDGLPYVADVRPNGPLVRAELVGTDCDQVRFVRVIGGDVWTAADDGVVRRYES